MRSVLICVLLVAVQLSECRETDSNKQKLREKSHYSYFDDHSCLQEEPDCEKCLLGGGKCEWCSDGGQRSECIKQGNETCPRGHRKTICESQPAEDEGKEALLEYYDKSLDELEAMDVPAMDNSVPNASVVTVNATVLCGRQGGCSNCTERDFCFWCESKHKCQVHFNETTGKEFCPKRNTAYYRQCVYPIGVTPCLKRGSSCKDCLIDGLCYWCESTKVCEFYPGGDDFLPNDCPREKFQHGVDCYKTKGLFWVLFPILAIILIPVIIYLIIWLICCCMRAAGYEPLEPAQSGNTRKHPKGIRLKPGSPSNKTDDLRKKYDLNNP